MMEEAGEYCGALLDLLGLSGLVCDLSWRI